MHRLKGRETVRSIAALSERSISACISNPPHVESLATDFANERLWRLLRKNWQRLKLLLAVFQGSVMRNRLWLLVIVPGLAACKDAHRWRSVLRDYARPDTVERLHVMLDGERARGDTARKLSQDLAQKNEYLLGQLNELSSIVNEIDRDLGGPRGGAVHPLVPNGELGDTASGRAVLEAKRERIAANLSRLTSRLRTSDSLWHAAIASDSSSRSALASSAETLAMFRTLAESRAVQFAEFEGRIDSLRTENRALADERDRMRDSLTRLSTRVGRVYYVVGTRDKLLSAGVIREVTGREEDLARVDERSSCCRRVTRSCLASQRFAQRSVRLLPRATMRTMWSSRARRFARSGEW